MIQVRDTFTHFIADNVKDASNNPIPVHQIRRDPNDPKAALLQDNSINLNFLMMDYDVHIGVYQVSIDICNYDELTACDWTYRVWHVLNAAFMTPKRDYTNPASPTTVGGNIYWKVSAKFRPIKNDFYYHYTCLLALHHHPTI